MSDHDPTYDERDDGIDRRRFLGGAAGLGAAAGLPGLPGDGGGDDPPIDVPGGEVPYVAARRHANHDAVAAGEAPPRREPVWATMPVDRWLRIEAANAAEHRVNAMLRERGAGDLVRAGTRLDGNGELIVDVHVVELETPSGDVLRPEVDVDGLRRALPSTARGHAALERGGLGSLGTATRQRKHEVAWTRVRQELQIGDVYDQRYRPVPGGAAITNGVGPGTTCTPAWDRDEGRYVMVTAGHVIPDLEPGHTVLQPEEADYWWQDNEIGESLDAEFEEDGDGDKVFDAATVDMADADVAYELAAAGSDGYDEDVGGIAGVVDWWRIQNDVHGGDLYRLQGSTTGRTFGEIQWTSDDYKVFESDADAEGGDSGGPHYKPLFGDVYIAGVHNYHNTYTGRSGATAIREVEGRFDLVV